MRRLIFLLLVFVWLGFAQKNPSGEVNDCLGRAEVALAQSDFQTAIVQLNRAFEIANNNTLTSSSLSDRVFVRFAEVRTMLGDYNEAEPVIRTALETVGAEWRAQALLISARASAFRGSSSALTALSKMPGAIVALADFSLQGGKIAEAKQWIASLPANSPRGQALLRARLSILEGSYANMETQLRAAEGESTNDPLDGMRLAVVRSRSLMASERTSASLKSFSDACAELSKRLGDGRPDPASCWAEAGEAAVRAGSLTQAREWLRKAGEGLANITRYPGEQPMGALREKVLGYEAVLARSADKARQAFDRSRSVRRRLYGSDALSVIEIDLAETEMEIEAGPTSQTKMSLEREMRSLTSVPPTNFLRRRAVLALAKLAAERKNWAEVKSTVAEWIRTRPASAEDNRDVAAATGLQADAELGLGNFPAAEPVLTHWIELRRRLDDLKPDDDLQLALRLIKLRTQIGKPGAAADLISDVLVREPAAFRRLNPLERERLLQDAVESREKSGQFIEAVRFLKIAIELRSELSSPPDTHSAQMLERVADLSKRAGQESDAIKALRDAWAVRRHINDIDSEEALATARDVAEFESGHNNFSEALPLWRHIAEAGRGGRGIGARNRALVLERLAVAQQSTGFNDAAAKTYIQLAKLRMENDDLVGAADFATRARNMASAGTYEKATAYLVLTDVRASSNDTRAVEDEVRQFLDTGEADPSIRALGFVQLVRLSITRRDYDAAEESCKRAETALAEQAVNVPAVHATVIAARARLLDAEGKASDAEAAYREFLRVEESVNSESDFPLVSLLGEASRFYSTRAQLHSVEEVGRRRLIASQRGFGELTRETATAFQSLGDTLAQENKLSEADDQYDRALQIFNTLPAKSQGLAAILMSRGDLFRRQGNPNEALRSYAQALNTDPSQNRILLNAIGALQRQTRDFANSEKTYARLRATLPADPTNQAWVDASTNWCIAIIGSGGSQVGEGLSQFEILRKAVRAAHQNRDNLNELNMVRTIVPILPRGSKDAKKYEGMVKDMEKRLNVSSNPRP